MTTHTPGPWRYSGVGIIYTDHPCSDNNQPIAYTVRDGGEDAAERAEMNAKLIAAAPDLLRAITGLVSFMQAIGVDQDGGAGQMLTEKAQVAIRSATKELPF